MVHTVCNFVSGNATVRKETSDESIEIWPCLAALLEEPRRCKRLSRFILLLALSSNINPIQILPIGHVLQLPSAFAALLKMHVQAVVDS